MKYIRFYTEENDIKQNISIVDGKFVKTSIPCWFDLYNENTLNLKMARTWYIQTVRHIEDGFLSGRNPRGNRCKLQGLPLRSEIGIPAEGDTIVNSIAPVPLKVRTKIRVTQSVSTKEIQEMTKEKQLYTQELFKELNLTDAEAIEQAHQLCVKLGLKNDPADPIIAAFKMDTSNKIHYSSPERKIELAAISARRIIIKHTPEYSGRYSKIQY